MKTAYVLHDGSPCWASIDGDDVPALQGDRFAAPGRGARLGSLAEMKLLSPIEPTAKLVALLSNWRGRDGRDGPGFFIKPRSTLINPGEAIVYPPQATRVDFEAEIGVVIGRRCRNVTPAEARDFVYGYTVVNDVTAFGLGVATNFDFLYGKSFDTFGVVGPWIVDDIDPDNQRLRAWIGDDVKCDTNTSRMNWNTHEVVSWISQVMTLNPGDVVSCGSPPDHEPFLPGDVVRVSVEGIGVLENPVIDGRG